MKAGRGGDQFGVQRRRRCPRERASEERGSPHKSITTPALLQIRRGASCAISGLNRGGAPISICRAEQGILQLWQLWLRGVLVQVSFT
uniref:Uncharacterized protein n=1 Tax=Oryza punctata TaxID=4537 RepID=A0A0E0ME89_ORYPU